MAVDWAAHRKRQARIKKQLKEQEEQRKLQRLSRTAELAKRQQKQDVLRSVQRQISKIKPKARHIARYELGEKPGEIKAYPKVYIGQPPKPVVKIKKQKTSLKQAPPTRPIKPKVITIKRPLPIAPYPPGYARKTPSGYVSVSPWHDRKETMYEKQAKEYLTYTKKYGTSPLPISKDTLIRPRTKTIPSKDKLEPQIKTTSTYFPDHLKIKREKIRLQEEVQKRLGKKYLSPGDRNLVLAQYKRSVRKVDEIDLATLRKRQYKEDWLSAKTPGEYVLSGLGGVGTFAGEIPRNILEFGIVAPARQMKEDIVKRGYKKVAAETSPMKIQEVKIPFTKKKFKYPRLKMPIIEPSGYGAYIRKGIYDPEDKTRGMKWYDPINWRAVEGVVDVGLIGVAAAAKPVAAVGKPVVKKAGTTLLKKVGTTALKVGIPTAIIGPEVYQVAKGTETPKGAVFDIMGTGAKVLTLGTMMGVAARPTSVPQPTIQKIPAKGYTYSELKKQLVLKYKSAGVTHPTQKANQMLRSIGVKKTKTAIVPRDETKYALQLSTLETTPGKFPEKTAIQQFREGKIGLEYVPEKTMGRSFLGRPAGMRYYGTTFDPKRVAAEYAKRGVKIEPSLAKGQPIVSIDEALRGATKQAIISHELTHVRHPFWSEKAVTWLTPYKFGPIKKGLKATPYLWGGQSLLDIGKKEIDISSKI